jgi:hypothetical protein
MIHRFCITTLFPEQVDRQLVKTPPGLAPCGRRLAILLAACCLLCLALPDLRAAGTWSPVAAAPGNFRNMLLLPDGTVMAASIAPGNAAGNQWFRLTPDQHGSYVNGTWSALASMRDTRMAYSSAVLRDGRVFVAGGEYGTGTATAEVYDPQSNSWTVTPPSGQSFSDSICKILSGGDVLVSPVFPNICGRTVIYHPDGNTWSAGPVLLNACFQDEASWVKLPDGSILTVDPFGTNSERYVPAVNQWVNDAVVPTPLFDSTGEIGAALLLPDGRAFFLGGTGHTALYTPSGGVTPGSWVAGPDIPNGQGTSDAPAAMMVNGKILCVVGPAASANGPSQFYEYDPAANSFTEVNGPTGTTDNVIPQEICLLDLPDGTVLFSDYGSTLYVYQPDGTPIASGKPTISNVTNNLDGSFHLNGTLLNGISEGAAFGDDLQMDSNYPLVRLSDNNGNVFYARTYNWSSTGVMTGNEPESTEFVLPATLPGGSYSLVVVANGISSDAVPFNADPLRIISPMNLAASGMIGGPFTPGTTQIVLTNAGAVPLTWAASGLPGWLSLDVSSGALPPAGPPSVLTLGVNKSASALGVGIYHVDVTISNLVTGSVESRAFTLHVTPAPAMQPYFNTVQLLNPVAYWRLDETNQPVGGGVATNLGSINAAGNGAFSGVVAWISGPFPETKATSFEGISSVTIPYSHALSLGAPFTVEVWVQPSTAQTADNVVCPLACGHFASPRSGWLIYQSTTGWNFRMYNQNQLNTSLNIEAGPAPVPGTWYHLAAVYDGTQGHIYVNGAGVSGTPSGFVANADGNFAIGTRSDMAFGFSGAIAEVALYTNALAAADVLDHFQTGTNGSDLATYSQAVLNKNPIAYYHLDAPLRLPVANNSGSLGTNGQGAYQLGSLPGVIGAPFPGLGSGNRACQFNGAAGSVDFPGTFLNFTNSLTVAAWVEAAPANGLKQCILSKGLSAYNLEMDETGHPLFFIGSENTSVTGVTRIDDGLWHLLTGVYNPVGAISLFVDGFMAAATNAPSQSGFTSSDLRLGGAPDMGTTRNFSGKIDEVVLFTNALSAAQIQQLYFAATNTAALSPAPPFVEMVQTNGVLLYSWSAAQGLRYQLQYSTNLTQTPWVNLGNPVTATNSVISVPAPLGLDRQRFYRTVLLP